MQLLNHLINFILSISINSPIYLINEYIESLQITPNSDTYSTPPEIITRHGYAAETYNIQTPDGFILTLHRIPHGVNKTEGGRFPILLVHGFLDSSFLWIANGPDGALAYLLADQGYDVWMMNIRGNTFSQSHANYTPIEKEFWNFSLHEVGVYDIPTTIDFILETTNHEQLFCVCYSIGSNGFHIMMSEFPEYNEKIIAQANLAPFYHKFSPIILQLFYPVAYPALKYLYWKTPGAFLKRDLLMKILIQIATSVQLFGYNLYDVFLNIVIGWHFDHINKEIMPTFYNNYPAGTSVKLTQHFLQQRNSFVKFDYGSEENLKLYGTSTPPEYNISQTRVPVRIYHAKFDALGAFPEDVQSLYEQLPEKAGVYLVPDLGFSHLDFIYNKNAKKLLYDDVITFVNNFKVLGSFSSMT